MVAINGRDMVLMVDAVDRSDEGVTWTLGYGERQTFADMRGTTPTVLNMEITQDLDPTSLYQVSISGDTSPLACIMKPLGNAAASVEKPHYTFNVTPSGPSGDVFMGGEAAQDNSQALTVEVAWLIDTWTEVTA